MKQSKFQFSLRSLMHVVVLAGALFALVRLIPDHSFQGTVLMTALWFALLCWLAILPLLSRNPAAAGITEVASHFCSWFVLLAASGFRFYYFVPRLKKLTMDFGVNIPNVTYLALDVADLFYNYASGFLLVLVVLLAIDGAVFFRLRLRTQRRLPGNAWSIFMQSLPFVLSVLSMAALWGPVLKLGKWMQP